MVNVNAVLSYKESTLKSKDCIVDKVIRLSGTEFDYFSRNLMRDWDFIRDNPIDIVVDTEGRYHCLLVVGEGRRDGVLVNSEGGAYARYSAFIPNVEGLLTVGQYPALAALNRRLTDIVDFIVEETNVRASEERVAIDLQELEVMFGIDLIRNNVLHGTVLGMLKERPEIRDWELDKNELIIYRESGTMELSAESGSETNAKHTPVYMHTFETARSNGETDLYRASLTLNMDCALAIEGLIKYGQSVKHTDAQRVINEYGPDRVLAVLAHTVREFDFGIRFSQESRDWAKGYPAPPRSEHARFTVDSHPSVVDEFIVQAREVAREIESEAAKDNTHTDHENEDISDPSVTKTDMYAYGYSFEGMIPLGKERALELFDRNYQVFRLNLDGSARVAVPRRDVETFSGMFGVLDPVKSREARSSSIEVFILNRERYEKGEAVGEWLTLPSDADTLRGLLERIGAGGPGGVDYSVSAIRLPHDNLHDYITKYDSLDGLNMLASYINGLEDFERDKLSAVLESGVTDIGSGTAALINILDADNFDAFNLIDAKGPEDLGRYWGDDKPDDISFEEYGKQIAREEKGVFTSWGYVHFRYKELSPAYTGDVPDEYRITGEALSVPRSITSEHRGPDEKPSVLNQIKSARQIPHEQKDRKARGSKKDKGGQEL